MSAWLDLLSPRFNFLIADFETRCHRELRPALRQIALLTQFAITNETSNTIQDVAANVESQSLRLSYNQLTNLQKTSQRPLQTSPRQKSPKSNREPQNRPLSPWNNLLASHPRRPHRPVPTPHSTRQEIHQEERHPPIRRCCISGILLREERCFITSLWIE